MPPHAAHHSSCTIVQSSTEHACWFHQHSPGWAGGKEKSWLSLLCCVCCTGLAVLRRSHKALMSCCCTHQSCAASRDCRLSKFFSCAQWLSCNQLRYDTKIKHAKSPTSHAHGKHVWGQNFFFLRRDAPNAVASIYLIKSHTPAYNDLMRLRLPQK